MITRGEVVGIDFNSNVYKVRVPLFETANDRNPVIVDALALIPPGIFNGYVEGDIVEIGFENSAINKAIILGKFYLGAYTESKNTGGSIYGDSLKITKNAAIPVDTQLTSSILNDIANTSESLSGYTSISDIIYAINELKKLVGDESVEDHIKRIIQEKNN